ncbi:phenoloxidase-activating factor 2-like [Aricia agestis]|uniref:phenoloxidase-activating factor 2-like n=1 Tax=Aricia agestis TaxID=91739 RepID=UPI001C20AD24|nr:phenoloxidase-activating factor 2-like [Aricia agestis]
MRKMYGLPAQCQASYRRVSDRHKMLRGVVFLSLALATLQSPSPRLGSDLDLTPGKANETVPSLPCTTDKNEEGFCVLYYQCKNNDVINVDGENLIDMRLKDSCLSSLEKCCKAPEVSPDNVPVPEPPQRKGCGWRNPNGISIRVQSVDGEAGFAEFPWMVAVMKKLPKETYLGGGSLIHPNAVLTAAHLVSGERDLKVRAGEWDTVTTREIYPHQERDVASVVVHKDFIKQTLYYNIALLFFTTPMELAPNVGVACLPPPESDTPDDTRCFATGWGKTRFGEEGQNAIILKKVEVPVVSKRTCRSQLRNTRLGSAFELHSTFMCAGGEPGRDTCRGDGGSPLVCPIEGEKNRYYQSGIVAWGIGCGGDGVPGVYVDVVKLRPWIDDKMAGRGLDLNTYDHNARI